MSQRYSGYSRKPNDSYQTPEWATRAVLPHLPPVRGTVWEPACGGGQMAEALRNAGFEVMATDLSEGFDFLFLPPPGPFCGIITNPPFALGQQFIERALDLVPADGFVALLARIDYDSAKTRRHLFADCPLFAKKLVLLRRIRWIAGSVGSPSFNHCWLIWDRQHRGPPAIAYGP